MRTQEFNNNPKGMNQVGSFFLIWWKAVDQRIPNKFKNKRKYKSGDDKSSNKKCKLVFWKCGKPSHFKKDCHVHKVNKDVGSSGSKDPKKQQGQNSDLVHNFNYIQNYVSVISEEFFVKDDNVSWLVDFDETSHVCKDFSLV